MSECNYFKSCAICGSKVKNVESHLSDAHEIDVEVKLLHFQDPQDFHKWKENIEKETVSRYVKQYGAKRRKDGRVVTYYHCHRDGNYVPKGRNKRSLKRIGSNKINGTCPSLIKAEQDSDGLKVRFVATHVGHTCDLGRMVLTTSEKDQIAAKANMKVPVEDILGEIRNSRTGDKLQRIHLTKKQDIRNIIVQYNLEDRYKSSDAEVGHCVQEIEIQCTEASQSSCNATELYLEEVGDLELKKRLLTEYIGNVILNIQTEAEFSVVEKLLEPLKEIYQTAKSPETNAKDCLNSTGSAEESQNTGITPQQNLKSFFSYDHDHLYQSLKEPPSQWKGPRKVQDSAGKTTQIPCMCTWQNRVT